MRTAKYMNSSEMEGLVMFGLILDIVMLAMVAYVVVGYVKWKMAKRSAQKLKLTSTKRNV